MMKLEMELKRENNLTEKLETVIMLLQNKLYRGPTEGACSMAVPAMSTKTKTSAL